MRLSLFTVFIFSLGCGGAQDSSKSASSGQLDPNAQEFDTNKDGKSDSWKFFRKVDGKQILARKEYDINFDGRVDIVRVFNVKGEIESDSMDMDFDGRPDVKTTYENNKPKKKELDLQFDGKPDVIRYYSKGRLVRLESDTDNDGKVDHWEIYKSGKLVRIGSDQDGDGQADPDKWIEK